MGSAESTLVRDPAGPVGSDGPEANEALGAGGLEVRGRWGGSVAHLFDDDVALAPPGPSGPSGPGRPGAGERSDDGEEEEADDDLTDAAMVLTGQDTPSALALAQVRLQPHIFKHATTPGLGVIVPLF